MSDTKQVYHIFTPNQGFTGTRNAGKHSTHFEKGVAVVTNKTTADIFVKNFNYFCPEIDGAHLEKVVELHGAERVSNVLGIKIKASKEKSEEGKEKSEEVGEKREETKRPDVLARDVKAYPNNKNRKRKKLLSLP